MHDRRATAALVVSIIALVGAWGGPAVAQKLIGSAAIKDRSIEGRDIASSTIGGRQVTGLTGRDIRPDSLQGSDIQEETLNQVAEAARADEVNGVEIQRFNYADPKGETAVFYKDAGIEVSGFCNNGILEARAVSTVDGAVVRRELTTPTTATEVFADNDYDPGDEVDLFPAGRNDGSGTITMFQPGGQSVLIQYLAASGLPPTGPQCLISGVAVAAER